MSINYISIIKNELSIRRFYTIRENNFNMFQTKQLNVKTLFPLSFNLSYIHDLNVQQTNKIKRFFFNLHTLISKKATILF